MISTFKKQFKTQHGSVLINLWSHIL